METGEWRWWRFISQKSLKIGVQYMGTKRELYRLLQLIMKIHIKNDMETVCTTQKTQGDPLYDGAENTCLIGF